MLTEYSSRKWHPRESKVEFEETFSIQKWKGLLPLQQKEHRIANCKACHNQHSALQNRIPQGPYYNPQPTDYKHTRIEATWRKEGT
jgi:hypothetical protein